jgi:DNA topoisomerase-1
MRLRYVTRQRAGITRDPAPGGFAYRRRDGSRVRDRATLARIRQLAIPPAWTAVWISTDPAGHLQATGRDARGRKQYRYHAAWTASRDAAKYDRRLDFARALPNLRRSVARDLRSSPLARRRVLATLVSLLERTHMRVGNVEYARTNGSYGLTTLRNRHARVRGSRVEFRFRGKSGVQHAITIDDPRIARQIRRCQELPGEDLFEYRDRLGEVRKIGSSDLNAYLTSCAGRNVTAKDFRTWWGTISAASLLREAGRSATPNATKRTVVAMFDDVARQLGNTRATCRKSYVHPHVVEAYTRGVVIRPEDKRARSATGLSAEEQAVVALLTQMRLKGAPRAVAKVA